MFAQFQFASEDLLLRNVFCFRGDLDDQEVARFYKLGILEYLASRFNIYCIRISGSGSEGRGSKTLHSSGIDPSKTKISDASIILK